MFLECVVLVSLLNEHFVVFFYFIILLLILLDSWWIFWLFDGLWQLSIRFLWRIQKLDWIFNRIPGTLKINAYIIYFGKVYFLCFFIASWSKSWNSSNDCWMCCRYMQILSFMFLWSQLFSVSKHTNTITLAVHNHL